MATLNQLVDIFRSKNAGPFYITIDIIFSDRNKLDLVEKANILTQKHISELYNIKKGGVNVYFFRKANAIKVVIPRAASSGSVNDSDVYGAQQHILLMNLEVNV